MGYRHCIATTILMCCISASAEPSDSLSFKATATGIGPTAQVEFILVGPESGHDYEAIAISSISADEIYDRLSGLGAEPGWPVRGQELQFHPRGERLNITFTWEAGGERHTVPAHQLIVDNTHGGHLLENYFLFTGSIWTTNDGRKTLAATVKDPGSILSTYNDPETLMDRPVRAPKSLVYGTLFPNPDYSIPEGTEIDVSISRVKEDQTFQPVTATVRFTSKEDQIGLAVEFFEFSGDYRVENEEAFLRLVEPWKTAYPETGIRSVFDSSMSLAEVQQASSWLAGVEGKLNMVVLPPDPRDLFFQTFLPPPHFRQPETRPSQPWEIFIQGTVNDDTCKPVIRRYEITSRDPQGEPIYRESVLKDKTLEEWVSTLNLKAYDPPVLLIHAPGTMTYGDLLTWLQPVRTIFDTYYVFL